MIICRTIERWGKTPYNLVKIPIRKACNGYYLRWYYNGWHYWFFLPGDQQQVTEGENYRTIGTLKITMSTGQITQQESIGVKTILLTREVYILTTKGWRNIRIDPGTIQIYESETEGAEIEITASIGSRELSRTSGFSPVPLLPEVPPVPDPTICEVVIGGQIWMCNNYDAEFPGSKVYDDDNDNAALYGRLYSYAQVQDSGFAPAGWRVPTQADWIDLITYIGGYAGGGGELKEIGTDSWDAPNTGAVDTHNFAAKGAGAWFQWTGYTNLKKFGYFWCLSPAGFNYAYYCADDTAEIKLMPNTPPSDLSFAPFLSVRLIKDVPYTPLLLDRDFNIYTTVIIGSQEWIVENFRSTKYADGSDIPLIGNDWFLPSRNELVAMFNNLKAEGVGGFADDSYWSSTETNATRAASVFFGDGTENTNRLKTSSIKIRPSRTYTTTNVYALRDSLMGGLIYSIVNNGSDYTYYIASTTDLADSAWSNIASTEIGVTAQGAGIGAGKTNTVAIIGQAGHTASGASLCDSYAYNWENDTDGAYCYYNNDIANKPDYGALYNWFAVNNAKGLAYLSRGGVQEAGWRVPTSADYLALITLIGGQAIAGGKLKEVGTTHWAAPNTGATDDYGFKALPGGYRNWLGTFDALYNYCYLWTATQFDAIRAYMRYMRFTTVDMPTDEIFKECGFSVRLVRDAITPQPVFDDWFLPSRDELKEIYDELFLQGVGGFDGTRWYWSSTEHSATMALSLNFPTGIQTAIDKSSANIVTRACRSFTGTVIDYPLRSTGPAGGLVFAHGGGLVYEASPADLSNTQIWSNLTSTAIGVTARGTAIGTGQGNTTAIIGQVGHTDSAAKICDDLEVLP